MRKTIYVSQENKALFELWSQSIESKVVGGRSVSNRIAALIRNDIKANLPKLRKAGLGKQVAVALSEI